MSAQGVSESQIKVRKVTEWQPTWTEKGPGEAGTYTFQLILDHGADEYVLRPTADDADVLLTLLDRSSNAHFDLERKVLMFDSLSLH